MSSRFGIVQADLTPVPVSDADWTALLEIVDGEAGLDLDTVIGQGEDDIVGHMMGMPAEAANIALAKPFAVAAVVWRLHFVKAQNGGYDVPDAVQKLYDAAVRWAATTGQKLLASEGETVPGVSGNTQYSVPDTDYAMSQTENL